MATYAGTHDDTPRRRPAAEAAGPRGSASADAAATLDSHPRQAAQRQAIAAAFGPSASGAPPIVQRVPAGRYRTTEDGNLRGRDKAVLAEVPLGTAAQVAPGAETRRFSLGLVSRAKDHTWAQCLGQEGWLRDGVLGPTLAPPQPVWVEEEPRRTAPSPTLVTPSRSMPMGRRAVGLDIGGGGGGRGRSSGPIATVTREELVAYRDGSSGELEDPGIAPGAEPLGLGGLIKHSDKRNFRIQVVGGRLYERDGLGLLTVAKSPFVLGDDGVLYGGQGDASDDVFSQLMAKHGQAEQGAPLWAGELAAAGGQVTHIDNQSGTYKLSDKANVNLIKFLYRARVLRDQDIDRLDVERVYKPGLDRDGELEKHDVFRG